MLFALHLVHLLADETPTGKRAKTIAVAKDRESLIGWYEQYMTDPYEDIGPDMDGGGIKSYTKHFVKGSPLEWLEPLQDYEVGGKGPSGIFQIPSFEEFQTQMDNHYHSEVASLAVRTQAQLDHYRNTVEPKMIKYAPTAKRTVQ